MESSIDTRILQPPCEIVQMTTNLLKNSQHIHQKVWIQK
jgi:hypothetical protein